MKRIQLALALAILVFQLYAQVPPFPSIDAAFAKVVMATYQSQILIESGLPVSKFKMLPKKEVKEWNNKYSEENSYFSAYTSTQAQKLFWTSKPDYPKDECHIIFSANSPKVGNEEYHSIAFDVVYTRLKNAVLTNTWEFKYVDYAGHYAFNKKGLDGKLMVENAIKALMQTKNVAAKIEDETVDLNGNVYRFYADFKMMASIDSVTFEKNEFNPSNYYLNFYGTYQNFSYDTDCTPYTAGIKKLVMKVTTEENAGKVVETQFRDYTTTASLSEILNSKEGYKTGQQLRFSELYQKPKQAKCENAPSAAVNSELGVEAQKKMGECLLSVLAKEKELDKPERLKVFLNPNDDAGYNKFMTLFKALEDQGYGWRNARETSKNTFTYEVYGRKVLNKLYKAERKIVITTKDVNGSTYFEIDAQ
jgi:hypothetical protein